MRIYAWLGKEGCFVGDSYEITISTNPLLLQRARNDITSAFNVDPDEVTPTFLFILQFNDARVNDDTAEVRVSCNCLCHYQFINIMINHVSTSNSTMPHYHFIGTGNDISNCCSHKWKLHICHYPVCICREWSEWESN